MMIFIVCLCVKGMVLTLTFRDKGVGNCDQLSLVSSVSSG